MNRKLPRFLGKISASMEEFDRREPRVTRVHIGYIHILVHRGFRITVARCWKLGATVTQEGNTSASGCFSFPRSACSPYAMTQQRAPTTLCTWTRRGNEQGNITENGSRTDTVTKGEERLEYSWNYRQNVGNAVAICGERMKIGKENADVR